MKLSDFETLVDLAQVHFPPDFVWVDELSRERWSTYPPDSYNLVLWCREGDQDWSVSIVFNALTFRVHEFMVWDNINDKYYRWIAPEFKAIYYAECFERQVEPNEAADGHKFIDSDGWEGIYHGPAMDMVTGKQSVPEEEEETVALELSDSELATIARAAHAKDMTINDFINEALRIKLDEVMPKWREEFKSNGY